MFHLKRAQIGTSLKQSSGSVSYTWKKGSAENSLAVDSSLGTENRAIITSPGYYK